MNPISEDELRCFFEDDNWTIDTLLSWGILYTRDVCPRCSKGKLTYNPKTRLWKCSLWRKCRYTVSVLKHSFFDGRRLPIGKQMRLIYEWIQQSGVVSTANRLGLSTKTVVRYFLDCRQSVSDFVQTEAEKVGAEGVIVEIDESKFGKRKNNRGNHIEGVWVFGGIEIQGKRNVFLQAVEDRTRLTLVPVIMENIEDGSTIHSDMWKAYEGLEKINNYEHKTVNHSKTFLDKETGVHTNRIEATWRAAKVLVPLPCRNVRRIQPYLDEYCWRKRHRGELFTAFLSILQDLKYFEE
ncbi:hypothetical protein GQ54DRAFT_300943 [Martensiomyces pterosporus]|nr:hypothetical protein GQ54DRAFT_300943 [Martensiomyces pterosporus]